MTPTKTQLSHATALSASAVATITGLATGTPTVTKIAGAVTALLVGLCGLYVNPPARTVRKRVKGEVAPFVMADGVTVADLPSGLTAYLAYITGRWANFVAIRLRFPHAKILKMSTTAAIIAAALDVETGDAYPVQCPDWVTKSIDAGNHRPVLYGSLSTWTGPRGILWELRNAKIPRTAVRVFTAHPTGVKHICGPLTCGELPFDADATQYDWAPGFDLTLCRGDFLDG